MSKDRGFFYPHDAEAEKSILCSALFDNSTFEEVADILTYSDFYITAHQMIFSAMSELFDTGQPIDLITLVNLLRKSDQLHVVGGAAFVSALMDDIPVSSNLPHHAAIVREKARLRQVMNMGSTLMAQASGEGKSAEDLICNGQEQLIRIDSGSYAGPISLQTAAERAIDRLENMRTEGAVSGISTGISQLDFMTAGLQNSDLIILAGRPSMGKTATGIGFGLHAARSGRSVGIFSLEMSQEQIINRVLSREAQVDSHLFRTGRFSKEQWERIVDASDRMSSWNIWIDDTAGLSASAILRRSKAMKRRYGLDLIIIDYLQLMKSDMAWGPVQATTDNSRMMKEMARTLGIPVILISQLNRKLEERGDKRPMLSDLRDSGAIEQDADLVLFVYRDEVYNRDANNPEKGIAELILAKQRNGPIGTVRCAWIDRYGTIHDLYDN